MIPALQGCLPEELAALCRDLGFPAFRAKQLWHWLHVSRAMSWTAMSNLPKAFVSAVSAVASPAPLAPLERSDDSTSGTSKWLLRLLDGETVESVLIPAADRATICVSSQVGCKMACAFCASGKSGFVRNLSAGEIVAQVLFIANEIGRRPDNVVFMGMGEPLDNYDNVLKAVRLLNHPDGLAIGARRITLSTSGVVPGIRRLATEGLQFELSVSLHAPDSALRRTLMPVENRFPLPELLDACRDYFAATKRLITFEYTLVSGLNDTPDHARRLAALLSAFPCRVNLIPLSPIPEFPHPRPPRERCMDFLRILRTRGLEGTLRDSKGRSVNAACGQLRRRILPPTPSP